MLFSKMSMILVPDDAARVKRYRFPKFLLSFSIFSVILSTGLFFWFWGSYMDVKKRVSRMAQLESANLTFQERFVDLALEIQGMAGELEGFEELKLDPSNRTAIPLKENRARSEGSSGAYSESSFDGSHKATSGNLILSMHRNLDETNNKASRLLSNRTALYSFVEKQNRLLAWVRPLLPKDLTEKLPILTPDSMPPAVGGSPEEN